MSAVIAAAPQRQAKKGLDSEAATAQRVQHSINQHRTRRDQLVAKRRCQTVDVAVDLDSIRTHTIAAIDALRPCSMLQVCTPLKQLRELLSSKSSAAFDVVVDVVLEHNAVQLIVNALHQNACVENQVEAAWCLVNLSAFTCNQDITSAVPYLIILLNSNNQLAHEPSAWTIGNLAADSAEIRETLSLNGCLPPLVRLCDAPNHSTALWALTNMLATSDAYPERASLALRVGLTDKLLSLLQKHSSVDSLTEATWLFFSLLSRLTHFTASASSSSAVSPHISGFMNRVTQSNLVHVFKLHLCSDQLNPLPLVRALTSLLLLDASSPAQHTAPLSLIHMENEQILQVNSSLESHFNPTDNDFLNALAKCLVHTNPAVRKECAYFIGNFCALSTQHICALLAPLSRPCAGHTTLLAVMLIQFSTDLAVDVRRELLLPLYNALSESSCIGPWAVSSTFIQSLLSLLRADLSACVNSVYIDISLRILHRLLDIDQSARVVLLSAGALDLLVVQSTNKLFAALCDRLSDSTQLDDDSIDQDDIDE